jgi:hypothetical protein
MSPDGKLKSEKELKALEHTNKKSNLQIKYEPLNVNCIEFNSLNFLFLGSENTFGNF